MPEDELDGIVIDEELARKTPCTCYKVTLPDGREVLLCWSKGVIGMLSKDQIEKYCPEKIIKNAPEKLRKRIEKFYRAAVETAGLPLRERLTRLRELLKSD